MSDPRIYPANSRVAAAHLPDAPAGLRRAKGRARRVIRPVVDLLDRPGGARRRQLLMGDPVTVYETRDGLSFVQARKDGYVGYVRAAGLGPDRPTTHWVSAPATHVYARADLKSPDRMALSLGSRIAATSQSGAFVETEWGFVPAIHLTPAGVNARDPVAVAASLNGTPYLWGGNSRFGIDCSGLVQAALLACGQGCPGDSDQQRAALGRVLPPDTPPRRGDLLFWAGHVAWAAGAKTLLHANAWHMAVIREPVDRAIARIAGQGGGPVIAHKRL